MEETGVEASMTDKEMKEYIDMVKDEIDKLWLAHVDALTWISLRLLWGVEEFWVMQNFANAIIIIIRILDMPLPITLGTDDNKEPFGHYTIIKFLSGP
jgi:hypothetical protein